MHTFILRTLTPVLGILLGLAPNPGAAESLLQINTPAKFAYLIDPTSDTVLFDKNAHAKMYPASMTKIMTTYIAFQQLAEGLIQLDDEVLISESAHRMGGSKMFIASGQTVRLKDLLRGIIIQSGNDASVALAEFLGGAQEHFAEMMNDTAEKLGANNTHFINASGWPDENHYTTAYDLALLSERLIEDFPDLYRIFAEKTFTYSDITQKNRNPLLDKSGVDGVKTGYTEASGYGMVVSGVLDGRRLLLVINGLKSAQQRTREAQRLLNIGFRTTASETFYSVHTPVTTLPLWYGEKDQLTVQIAAPVTITVRKKLLQSLTRTVTYRKPLLAPISAGTPVGQLHFHIDQKILRSVDLLASEDVAGKGYVARFFSNIRYLLWGETP